MQIRAYNLVPVVILQANERFTNVNTGIIEQNIDLAEFGFRLRHTLIDLFTITDIHHQSSGRRPVSA
jgi:hypothetical protein